MQIHRHFNIVSGFCRFFSGKFTGPPIGCTFRFRGGALDPSTLAGRTGTQVRVENRDGFTHELAVDSLPGFTPLEAGPGKARVISVPAGGPWELSDRIYGHVDGHLHSLRELVATCLLVALIVATVFAIRHVGFIPAASGLVFALSLAMGMRPIWLSALASIAVALSTHFIFSGVFGLVLAF